MLHANLISLLITKYSAITLLDELDKDRNQLDCFSFSVEAGDWEAESSILGFLEAGGSEGTWNKDRQEKSKTELLILQSA